MNATFIKATLKGKLSYIPVTEIREVTVSDPAQPRVLVRVQEGGIHSLSGEEAAGVLAILEQLSQAPAADQGAA